MLCGQSSALRSSAAGSLPLRKSAVPRAGQLTSSVPAPRYGFAVVKPGRYSSRPCVIFALRAVLVCVPHRCGPSSAKTPQSLPGSQDTALPRCWRRQSPDKPALDCAGLRSASASWRCTSIRRSVPVREVRHLPHQRQCHAHSFGPSRPRPRRPSSHPSRRSLPLLQGAQGLPSAALQSPPPPHTRPPPRPRSTSFRALWHCQTLSRHPQSPRTPSRRLRDWTAP